MLAEVIDTHKEQESFARLDNKNVVTLNVIKRSGKNLILASDAINTIVKEYEESILPPGLDITITADQSDNTRVTLHDLINTIIIGFILVTIILMFFMGATNAIFVGLSVPLSSFIAFLWFPVIGFTLNMMTLFSFLLALGIVVDDAIVVIENTHRVFDNGKVPIRKAAKIAAGEIFIPVFSGTLVVLAPFIPLAFWPGVIGKFMMFLPITLIIALLASLVVAYIINPVFAADFMKPHEHEHNKKPTITKGFKITAIVFGAIALLSYLIGVKGFGNFIVVLICDLCATSFLYCWRYHAIPDQCLAARTGSLQEPGNVVRTTVSSDMDRCQYDIPLYFFDRIYRNPKSSCRIFPAGRP